MWNFDMYYLCHINAASAYITIQFKTSCIIHDM